MNDRARCFDHLLNRHKKLKNQKNKKLSHCIMLCDLIARKNNKLEILLFLEKVFPKQSYHV
jgi:hypothetical protein